MDGDLSSECSILHDMFQRLFIDSNTSSPEKALETLIESSRTSAGRADLASKSTILSALQLCQNLTCTSSSHLLLLTLKLLRNLCAGERNNQILFLSHDGVGTVLSTLNDVGIFYSNFGIIRTALQVLANVSLAGEMHQLDIWRHFFPIKFSELASVRRKETCDPLSMIIYTCICGNGELTGELCGNRGLPLLEEIIRTASIVGSGEDWIKLLLSKICFEDNHFPELFSRLFPVNVAGRGEGVNHCSSVFGQEQAFMLNILSEMLNERLGEMVIPIDFAMCVLEIFKQATKCVDSSLKGKSSLPTGSADVDVLGYSLTILREICADKSEYMDVVVDSLLSSGLIGLLLSLLAGLEPAEIIKKAMRQSGDQQGTSSKPYMPCPYKGFRRDIVGVIGNCAFQRKPVQDDVRERKGILLLLQQCCTDEDNPFLREWGIFAMRNLLEGNVENQQQVAELELQEAVDVPEIANLGMRVEVDPKRRCAKLVNIS